jgi:sec-independent protein translocase protein TatA
MLRRPVFAILPSLGWQEMFLLIVIGLLLYGRNLPQAGRTFGRFAAQLKRGFQDFKDQMDRDETVREMRKTLDETKREMQRATAVPNAIANPAQAVRELAHEAMTARADDASVDEDVADEPPPPKDKDPYADRREDHGAQPS